MIIDFQKKDFNIHTSDAAVTVHLQRGPDGF